LCYALLPFAYLRWPEWNAIAEQLPGLEIASINASQASGLDDVLGYFTGAN